MHNMLRLALLWVFCKSVTTQDVSFVEDVKALSELPLDKLLHIKKSFDVDGDDNHEEIVNSTNVNPQALPLQAKKTSKESEVYHYDSSDEKDKSSSIQSIFQISITTLAFLAFGGYLICLLVQAVKGKNNDYQTTATQIMSALLSAKVKRRRPTRAPYRLQQKPTTSYRRRKPRPKRETMTDFDMENMYYTLISLSESYTKYHTEDYLRYNISSNYF